jgi:hypothetical protein
MTIHLIHNPGPQIETPATRSLLHRLDWLAKHDPSVHLTVEAIRGGDNERLMDLVRRTQHGDRDAAVVAIGALLPRLCKVVINRRPPNRWKPTIDEYLTLAFLAMADLRTSDSSTYLADKLIARTRLRHERQLVTVDHIGIDLVLEVAASGTDVEEQVLARLEFELVADAVRAGQLSSDDLTEVAGAMLGEKLGRPRTEAERQHLARTRRRLARNITDTLNMAA